MANKKYPLMGAFCDECTENVRAITAVPRIIKDIQQIHTIVLSDNPNTFDTRDIEGARNINTNFESNIGDMYSR